MTENFSKPLSNESVTQPEREASARSPLAAAFGSPVPAAAYAVPAAISAVVAMAVLALSGPVDTLLIIDGRYAQLSSIPPAAIAVAAAVALLGQLFGYSATLAAVADRVAGTRRGVAAYWASAGRRPGRFLAAVLVAAITAAPFALLGAGLTAVGSPTWLTLVLSALLLMLIAPIALAVPLAVLTPRRPLAAIADSWRLVRRMEPRRPSRARLFVTIVVAASAVWAAWAATGLLGQSTGVHLLGDVGLAVVVVLAVLLCTAVTTGVVVAGQDVLDLLASEGRAAGITATAPGAAPRAFPAAAVLLVVAVLLPGALVAGSVAANPAGLTRTSVATVGDSSVSIDATPLGDDGAVTLSASPIDAMMSVCLDATCDRTSITDYYSTAMGALDGGNVLTAQWVPQFDSYDDPLVAELLVTVSTPGQLAGVEVEGYSDLVTIPGTSTVVDAVNSEPRGDDRTDAARLAVDTTGEFPVIASIDTLSTPGPDARLAVHRCLDADCAAVDTVEQRLTWTAPYGSGDDLDVAVTTDGTVFVSVMSVTKGSQLRLVTFPEDGTPSVIELDRVNPADRGSAAASDEVYGAQVVATGSGTAAVLYRPFAVAALQLFACTEDDCAGAPVDFPEQSEGVWPSTAFAVDSTGRPLVAAHDPSTNSVVVISCIDASCADTESRVVAHDANPTGSLSLTVDRADRPLVTTGNYTRYGEPSEYGPPATIIRCAESRCGAE